MDQDKNTTEEQQPKKCYCARCFMPIDPDDKVEVGGQNFHRLCSTCCICHKIPTTLKLFYGHVFCNECFKNYVLNRFKGESPMMHSNSWWLQWAGGVKAQGPEKQAKDPEAESKPTDKPAQPEPAKNNMEEPDITSPKCGCCDEHPKRCICARCLQAVDDQCKVTIGDQNFHPQCCRCYFCHCVPKDKVKIYYGQVFCEECFHKFVMARNKDTPAEHFKQCFEQWTANTMFAERMRKFMASGRETAAPTIFMMQGAHPPFCRCGNPPRDWLPANEPRKSATPASRSSGAGSAAWGLSERRTEASDDRSGESANQALAAAEKIEKLTKYLKGNRSEKSSKKWKNFVDTECDKESIVSEMLSGLPWVDLQDPKIVKDETSCPKCLWQCGSIYVNSENYKRFARNLQCE